MKLAFPFKLFSIFTISLLGILVYSNTFHGSFHSDDQLFIADNPVIRNVFNLHNIWNYYPCRFMAFVSFALNYHWGKLDVFGYHLFNLAVHLLSSILVWWLTLLTLLTPKMKENKIARHAHRIALLTGLVFVSHPIQTEAVTFIWQRTASMASLFYLASLCFYIKSRSNGGIKVIWYICSLISAIMAMFTKEISITLPLLILLYEIAFLKSGRDIKWKRLFPFIILIFIIPLITMITHSAKVSYIQGSLDVSKGISPEDYVLTQFRVMLTYVRLAFLPFNQNIDYDYPISKSIFELPTLFSFLFIVGVLLIAQRLFSNYRLVSFSICWFFLTLMPESIPYPVKDVIFEHRLYLPMAGFSLFLVAGAYYLLGRKTMTIMVVALSVVIGCNSILTYQRNKIWRDQLALLDDTVQKSPHKTRPLNNRGYFYYSQGDLAKAKADFNKAIGIDPRDEAAYNSLGLISIEEGDLNQAIGDFYQALKMKPGSAEAYINLGNAYVKQGNFKQAMTDYTRAIFISPQSAQAYYNRASLYIKKGNLTQAILDFTKAIDVDPNNEAAYYNRGLAYYIQGNLLLAKSDYDQTIQIDPNNSVAYFNRSLVFYKQGNLVQAVWDLNNAIALNPDDAEAYSTKGNIEGMLSQYPKAIADLNKAIKINPHFAQAYNNRAVTYYQLKEYSLAWSDVNRAQELGAPVNNEFLNALRKASGKG